MVERKELEEKLITYRIVQARLDGLMKQRDLILSKILEIQNTLASIEGIREGERGMVFPIGSEAYTFVKAIDKARIIVEVGAGIALEKSFDEGKGVLKKRMDELSKTLEGVQKAITQASITLNQLGPEIGELSKRLEGEAVGAG